MGDSKYSMKGGGRADSSSRRGGSSSGGGGGGGGNRDSRGSERSSSHRGGDGDREMAPYSSSRGPSSSDHHRASSGSRGGGGGGSYHPNTGAGRDEGGRGNYGGGGSGGGRDSGRFTGEAIPESELMKDRPKKPFSGRCRLFVGNLPNEVKEPELRELFSPHGDIGECFISPKGFAFLKMDTRAHAESAKEALDAKVVKGRTIRVRFAVHGATIKVRELAPVVSNEMLHLTFASFGDVERAVHIVDEKGKPTGEGIIEFERKGSALDALNQIKDKVFLMTANSRPLQVEMLEPRDEEDGLSERMLQRNNQLIRERELGPRFATSNSFEHGGVFHDDEY